jgi:trigger factor
MQVTETLSEGLRRAYQVVVPAADVETRRSARIAELTKTLRLPGFRPGKVPSSVVRQRYGAAVGAEVLEESVSEATQRVLSDRGLRPAMQPKVDLVDPAAVSPAGPARDIAFTVQVELLPEIAVPDLSAVALTRIRAEVPAETVDKALTEIANRNRDLVAVEEARGAATGEVLKVDYVGKIDGVPFNGGTGSDTNVEIGGTGFIPGFSEQMEGLAAGETRTITVTFPAEYGVAELAGKEATFDITAKELLRPVVPAMDDAFAEKIGFENLEEIRKVISQQMQREYDQLSRLRLKRELLDKLAELADFAAPQGMVDAEFGQIWQRLEAERAQGRTDEDDAGKDDDTLRAEYRAIAERRVRLGLLLAEIGRANGITITNDEMTRAMRAEAGRYQGQEAQVMEFFRKNPQAAESLRGPIFEDKVVDYVIELAQVTDQTVSPEELARDPDAAAEAAPTEAEAPAAG